MSEGHIPINQEKCENNSKNTESNHNIVDNPSDPGQQTQNNGNNLDTQTSNSKPSTSKDNVAIFVLCELNRFLLMKVYFLFLGYR